MLARAEARLEDLLLDDLELGLEGIDDREVAVDHRVHQGVEDERRAVLEQMRLALGPGAHPEEALLGAVAAGEDEIRADEDGDLAQHEVVGRADLHHVQHGEQGVVVLLDLRPLVAVAGVLDRELVQAELLLHLRQLLGRGVLERDPDEAAGLADVLADVVDRHVAELRAVLVGHAVDEHGAALPRRDCSETILGGGGTRCARGFALHSTTTRSVDGDVWH